MSPIRVLVVDDSPTVRAVLRRRLAADAQIEVIATVGDGLAALAEVDRLKPDVVTLDIEMPRLDGLATLERLMQLRPTPVVMVSSLTREGADATLRALELGAVDFIDKPTASSVSVEVGDALVEKVRHAAVARVRRGAAPPRRAAEPAGGDWAQRVLVIGASTGGPQAVRQVVAALPEDFGLPVVVVQHMPAGFTRSLAERMHQHGPLRAYEAEPGMALERGVVLVAPGGHHLEFDQQGSVRLSDAPPELGVRPAVNVTLASVAALPGLPPLVSILTGMGHDGMRGAGLVKAAGGTVIAEAESSCVVFGMPRAVIEAGFADEVVPLDEMPQSIVQHARVSHARVRPGLAARSA